VSYISPHFKDVTLLPSLQNKKDRNWQLMVSSFFASNSDDLLSHHPQKSK